MGELRKIKPVPWQSVGPAASRRPKWTRPSDYHVVELRPAAKRVRWFPVLLVALPAAAFTAVLLAPSLGGGPDAAEASAGAQGLLGAFSSKPAADRELADFPLCDDADQRFTCVVDGDTFWYEGTKIRIADIDTPEVSRPGCANEAELGAEATLRLQELLNTGAFTLADNPDGRATDKYGRALHIVERKGESIGATLVDEGLAEEWGGPRIDWC